MSFILDALRKSEAERRRQAGPTLHELRAAPRRARLPGWVILILVALGLNLLMMGYLLLRKTPTAEPPRAIAPIAAQQPQQSPAPASAPMTESTTALPPATVSEPAAPAPAASPMPASVPLSAPESLPAGPPRVAAAKPLKDEGQLVTAAELASRGVQLPELQLSLHAFDADASRRYVLLNGQRLREGDTSPDGVKVERITEDGVAVAWQGRHFMVPRGE